LSGVALRVAGLSNWQEVLVLRGCPRGLMLASMKTGLDGKRGARTLTVEAMIGWGPGMRSADQVPENLQAQRHGDSVPFLSDRVAPWDKPSLPALKAPCSKQGERGEEGERGRQPGWRRPKPLVVTLRVAAPALLAERRALVGDGGIRGDDAPRFALEATFRCKGRAWPQAGSTRGSDGGTVPLGPWPRERRGALPNQARCEPPGRPKA
jgi:hypothetical protein